MGSRRADPKPKWWELYLTFPLLMGLFFLDSRLQLSAGGHELVQLGSLFLEFALVHLWLRANSSALSRMDDETYRRTITIITLPPRPRRESGDAVAILPRPPAELPGVLGDTLETDRIDALAYPVQEARQASKKE